MKRGYSNPILPLIKLCLLILLITQNIHGYPRHITVTTDVDRSADLTTESWITANHALFREISEMGGSRDPEERSNDNDVLKRRNRRNTSSRSFKDLENMQADRIIFPEDDIPRPVPVCMGSTYCEKVRSYPENLVSNAIQRNESLKYLAGVDVVSSIIQRNDATDDDVPLCVSTEQVIFPQTAENKDNQWKYIANQDNFKQGIRIEKCSKENTSCNVIGGPGEGYRTTCKQKYVYRQLAAVLSDGTIVPDTFKFPSSCCCHVSFTGSPFTRMGQVTPAKTRKRK